MKLLLVKLTIATLAFMYILKLQDDLHTAKTLTVEYYNKYTECKTNYDNLELKLKEIKKDNRLLKDLRLGKIK